MNDNLQMITGLTGGERKKVLSWMSSLTEERVIDIVQCGVKKGYQIKDEYPELPGRIVKYCALILAVREAGWDTLRGKGYRVAEKPQFDDFDHIRKDGLDGIVKKSQKNVQAGRTPVVRKRVMAYWGEVVDLKSEGIGFRKIAAYLVKKRKVKVSWAHLAKIWKEVENA